MKKLSLFLISLALLSIGTANASDMKFEEAIAKPDRMTVLIYADWSDDTDSVLKAYDAMEAEYGDKYNFTKINICTGEAKVFNKSYHIYPNLPYVLLFKDRGKVSRYLKKDCILNKSCFKERLDFFLN